MTPLQVKNEVQKSGAVLIPKANLAAIAAYMLKTTRVLTEASGDVAYTGVGFTPSAIIFFVVIGGGSLGRWGLSDGVRHGAAYRVSGATTIISDTDVAILCDLSGGNSQSAVVKSFDADGFTLTWTKTGSPTGTAIIYCLPLR
jgi:hypothetical protein